MSDVRTVSEMKAVMSPAMEALRNENAELRALLKKAERASGETDEIVLAIQRAQRVLKPVEIKIQKHTGKVSHPVSAVVQLTDLHVGLKTKGSNVEYFGAYNWDIAQARISDFGSRMIGWIDSHRPNYNVNECVILGTGDWISGDIHEGLIRTNEFPVPVQVVKAGNLISGFVQALAANVPKVRVEFITMGNHDRLTRKPQAQDGGWNSYGFVVGSIVQESLRGQGNVTVNIHPVAQDIVEVAGQRYLCGHGAGIIGTWGIPYYGIDRKKQREAMARMNMPENRHFHKIVIGHFHSALNHEHWNIGGSLSGTDENDHGQGRHSQPHQTAWLVHPKYGEEDWNRWYL